MSSCNSHFDATALKVALCNAAALDHKTCVASLIKEGADVNGKTRKGKTALTLAAANGHLKRVEMLVEAGAQLNDVDEEGRTERGQNL